jgi:hypothetical protein
MRSDIVPGGVFPEYELPDHINSKRFEYTWTSRRLGCRRPVSLPRWNRWSPQRFAAERERLAS